MLIPVLVAKKSAPTHKRRVHAPSRGKGSDKTKESYEELRKIGEGGQGKLYLVKRKRDNKLLVRKEQTSYDMIGDVPSEMHIFEDVLTHHPSIIHFDHAGYLKPNNSLVLYFEYCQGGDLHDYLPKPGERGVSEEFLWQCFIQLAAAIAFLHYGYNHSARDPDIPPRGWARVIHRDLKPENVFLRRKLTSNNPVPEIVLGDFGLATLQAETYGAGTPQWCGPEYPRITKQSDVWGVGAIIHALAHGRGPVPSPPRDWARGWKAEDMWYASPQARHPKQLSMDYSSALNRNMMDCLRRDPDKRPNSLDLFQNLMAERPRVRRRR